MRQIQKSQTGNQSEKRIKPAMRFLVTSKHNLFIIFLLLTLGLQGLIFLQIIFLNLLSLKIANRPVPSLVQLTDGNTAITKSAEPYYRTPKVINKFINESLSMLFTWTGKINNNDDISNQSSNLDPGFELDKGKITTAAYEASFALSPELRSPFLNTLAEMIPDNVFSGRAQSILIISHLSEPETMESGTWKVEMIASLLLFSDSQKIGEAIPINKEIHVRAIPPPPMTAQIYSTPLQELAYRIRSAGLEIFLIRDLPVK